MSVVRLVGLGFCVVAISGCQYFGGGSSPDGGGTHFGDGGATLSAVSAIFTNSCAGGSCHIGYANAPSEGLDLGPANLCANLLAPATELPSAQRVQPGAPSKSYLLCKVDPSCSWRASNTAIMPYGSTTGLPAADRDTISSWIAAGAPGCAGKGDQPPTFAGAASATGLTQAIQVKWSAATDDVTPQANIVYLVYEASSSGGESFSSPTYTTQPGATSYTVTGLPPSATRYYVVRAEDGSGNIDSNTKEVSATTAAGMDTTPPTFAGATSATAAGSTAIAVSWSAATDNGTPAGSIVYRVYVGTSSGGEDFSSPAVETAAGATSAIVQALSPATTYYAVVHAVDLSNNEDANTAEVSASTNPPVAFSADVQPIFTASCTGKACHGGMRPAEGLDLTSGNAWTHLVNVPSAECSGTLRVKPGDISASYLADKITGVNICFGSQMPKIGSLTATQIQTILDWIAQGAKND